MKPFRPDLTHGMRPYLALALILFVLYLAFSPFVQLSSSGSTQNSNVARHYFTSTPSDAPRQTGGAPQGNHGGMPSGGGAPPGGHSFGGSTTSSNSTDATARGVMLAGLLLAGAATGYLGWKRRLTPHLAALSVITAGCALRFGYMLYTPYSLRGHDVGGLGGNGHLAYLQQIYTNFALPTSNSDQFYHPPLSYICEALVAHLYAFVTRTTDLSTILEAARLVPCFASCALLLVCWRIFGELRFSSTAKLAALAVLAFHPTFFILSASINNDMLMVFFFLTAFLYTIRWYHQPTMRHSIPLALSSGAAMMTKFSGGLIVILSGIVFLVVLVRELRQRLPVRQRFAQLAVCSTIFLPLGLWYSVRNLIRFGQPIGYVLNPGMQPISGVSMWERFFSLPFGSLLSPLYCNPMGDSRLLLYTVKCSLFGEFSFSDSHQWAARVLIVLNLLLIVLSLAGMVLTLLRRGDGIAKWSFFAIWGIVWGFFLYFNVQYPYSCTMDFRYIVPTLVAGAAFLGSLAEWLQQARHLWLLRTLWFLIAAFAATSAVFYMI